MTHRSKRQDCGRNGMLSPVNPVCNRIRIQEYVTRGLPWIVSATVIPEEISPESYDNYDSDVDGDAQDGASVFLASLAIAHETYGGE